MDGNTTYELLDEIGRGEAATVYCAYDSQLKRYVAVKALHDRLRRDPRQSEHFWEEAQFLASLEHDNVVKVYGLDKARGWIIMELMRGSLDTKLAAGPLPHDLVRSVLRQTLEGLGFLHQKGKLHGGVKPANLLINDEGRVRLSDSAGLVAGGAVRKPIGSHKYLAPELLNPAFGGVTPAVDLYCLGFTALELLLGDEFNGLFPGVGADAIDPELGWMRWHSSPDPQPFGEVLAALPPDLARVIERLLEKEVAKRYAGAEEALHDLKNLPILAVDLPAEAKRKPTVETHGGKPVAAAGARTAPPKPVARNPVKATPPPGKKGPEPWSNEWMNEKLKDKRVLTAVCALIAAPTLAILIWPSSPAPARVTVTTKPEGATVAVDRKTLSKLTNAEYRLTAGKHKIKLTLPGYLDKEDEFDAKAGEETPLSYELEREGRKVRIASNPTGASVTVDDQDLGKVTDAELTLSPGKHTLRLALSGFKTAQKDFDVKDKGDNEVEVTLESRNPGPTAHNPGPGGGTTQAGGGGTGGTGNGGGVAGGGGGGTTGRAGRFGAVLVATPNEGYPFAEADVDELAGVLTRAGYAKADVAVAKNPGAARAMKMVREAGARRGPSDTLLVVFAGREPAPLADALREMAGSPAGQKLLVADVPEASEAPPPGVSALYSRARGQMRYLHLDWRHSAFFHAATLGLSGAADADRNGEVTADEYGKYLTEAVTAYVRKEYPQQPVQTPTRAGGASSSAVVAVTPVGGAARLYSQGLQALDAGDPGAAVDDLARAVAADGSFAPALVGRARAALLRGALGNKTADYAEALNDCRTALGLDPKSADAYATRGELLWKSGRLPEALADLDLVVSSLAPAWASAYQTRARVRRDLKSYADALADLNKAVGLAPLNYALFEERGVVRVRLKDYPGAERDFIEASALNPNWYLPYQDLAELARRRKDPEAARKWKLQGERLETPR